MLLAGGTDNLACGVCKINAKAIHESWGTKAGQDTLAAGIEYACENVVPKLGYSCDRTNMLKLRPSILPLVFEQILQEDHLCTY